MKNLTKEAIKKTFIRLLEEKPMSQITVKMLVSECEMNRNTFYYHYQDLPALVEEIVKDEVDRIMNEYTNIESIETALYAVSDFASKNRNAILHIYNSIARDIFEKYLWEVCDYVVDSYGERVISGFVIDEFDKKIISGLYKSQCFGLAIGWLEKRVGDEPRSEIKRLCELNGGMLEEMVRRSIEDKK